MNNKQIIVEKKLGIPADYQYKAIRSKNFLQRNWHKNKLIVVNELLNFSKESSVLDLGPGSGNFELQYCKKVSNIVAIDYNNEAINFLYKKIKQRKIKNITLKVLDVRNLSRYKTTQKFDFIVMIDVIEHIKINEAEQVVKEMNRLLKKGGRACIITPNYKSFWVYIERILDLLTIVPKFDNQQHLAKFHKQNLIQMFEKRGFKTNYIGSFNLFAFFFPKSNLSQTITKFELNSIGTIGNLLVGVFEKKK